MHPRIIKGTPAQIIAYDGAIVRLSLAWRSNRNYLTV
ncbi:hypothetical protein BH23CHL1_BH23CHL1_12120 [soil metagenome]